MKKDFTEQCIEAVLDRIGPVRAVAPKFNCILKEQVSKIEFSDDASHSLKFTVNYPNHKPKTVETSLTLAIDKDSDGLGLRHLLDIKKGLNDYPVVSNNYELDINKCVFSKNSYKGVLEFVYKSRQ